jgi:hypothetical protein
MESNNAINECQLESMIQMPEQMASQFNTHDHYFEEWVEKLRVSEDEILYALNCLNKNARFKLICKHLKPMSYLADYPDLLKSVHEMDANAVKALPENIFQLHLAQLTVADAFDDARSKRHYPYQSYDAQAFYGLRVLNKKTDLKFIKQMFVRSISHHAYPSAMDKLKRITSQAGFTHCA